MKRFIYLSFGISISIANLSGQQSTTDSLLGVIAKSSEDSNKANTLNLLAWEMVLTTGDYEKTLQYANEAIVLSEKIDYKKGHAKALLIIGSAYMLQGDYPEALTNYRASLAIKEEMGDKKGVAMAYSNIGLVYMYQGAYAKALKNFKAALKMEEELGDSAGIAGSYNNIGIVYEDLGNYPEALNNYLASVRIKQEIGDKKGLANTVSNIGVIKEIQRNFDEALQYHRAALRIRNELKDQRGIADCYSNIGNIYKELGNFPEALKNQLACLKIYDEIGNKSGTSNAYSNIGQIYKAQGDSAMLHGNNIFSITDRYPKALENYLAGLQIREEIGDVTGVAASLASIGAVHMLLHSYKEAEKYLIEALEVSREIGYKKVIKDTYKELSALDSIKGNMGLAFEHYKMFIIYKDSLFNEENTEKTFAMQMQYEIEDDLRREEEAELARQKEIKRRNQLQFTVIFTIVFLVIVIILLLGFVKVPVALAQALNFIALLLMFESILVFTDPYLDVFTKGVPAYKLMVNILWAILIFPLHRFLERRFKKRLKVD